MPGSQDGAAIRVSGPINAAGLTLTIETGRLANLADGAVLLTVGDTNVLSTVATSTPREGIDFFRETTSTGDVREFATSKLAPGAEWKNYTVRVVANIDGRDVSKEETITLTGGENKDLSFDFNTNAVASTAAVTR